MQPDRIDQLLASAKAHLTDHERRGVLNQALQVQQWEWMHETPAKHRAA